MPDQKVNNFFSFDFLTVSEPMKKAEDFFQNDTPKSSDQT